MYQVWVLNILWMLVHDRPDFYDAIQCSKEYPGQATKIIRVK